MAMQSLEMVEQGVVAPDGTETLRIHAGKRTLLHATVAEQGRFRTGTRWMTCLRLVNLTDAAGRPVFAHYWLPLRGQMKTLDAVPGERIEFAAQLDRELDGNYLLSHPTRARKL